MVYFTQLDNHSSLSKRKSFDDLKAAERLTIGYIDALLRLIENREADDGFVLTLLTSKATNKVLRRVQNEMQVSGQRRIDWQERIMSILETRSPTP